MARLNFATALIGAFALAFAVFAFTGCDPNPGDHGSSGGDYNAAGTLGAIEDAPADQLSAHAPRIRAVPPGVRITAAYMQLANRTNADDRLVAVRMAGAGRVEIHETVVDDEGVMRMRPLEAGLPLPAGTITELKPGGAHIMLMQLQLEPQAGETIALDCDFAVAGTRRIEARVFDAQ